MQPSTPNLYFAFAPIFYLSSIFGIMPLTFQFEKENQSWRNFRMKTVPWKIWFSIIFLIFSVIHLIMTPFYVLQASLPAAYPDSIFSLKSNFNNNATAFAANSTKQSSIMNILSAILVGLMNFTMRMVALLVLRSGLSKFFSKVQQTDEFLKFVENYEKIVNTRRHVTFSVGVVACFVLINAPTFSFFFQLVCFLKNYYGLIWCFILTWWVLTPVCGDLTFIFCAYLIKVRFKVINMALSEMKTKETCLMALQEKTKYLPTYE